MKRIALLLAVLVAGSAAYAQEIPAGLVIVDANGEGHASDATVKIVTRAVRVLSTTHRHYDYLTFECNSDDTCRRLAQDTIRFFPHTAQELVTFAGPEPEADKDGSRDADGFLRHGCGATEEGCKTASELIEAPDPEYTAAARAAHYSGVCLVQLTVGTDGLPVNLEILHHVPWGLDQTALAAVRKYKFKPATADGKAVASIANIQVHFEFKQR